MSYGKPNKKSRLYTCIGIGTGLIFRGATLISLNLSYLFFSTDFNTIKHLNRYLVLVTVNIRLSLLSITGFRLAAQGCSSVQVPVSGFHHPQLATTFHLYLLSPSMHFHKRLFILFSIIYLICFLCNYFLKIFYLLFFTCFFYLLFLLTLLLLGRFLYLTSRIPLIFFCF